MRSCRRCLEEGHPIVPGAIFSGPASARVMVVGQAPGITESEAGRPFNGPSGRRLFRWLSEADWEEQAFRATHYVTAVTKCYPGRTTGGKGDRVPTRSEQRLCAPFLEQELELVDPELVIPVGGVAIRTFLGQVRLAESVGRAERDAAGRWIVPLPHPSGASLWLNQPRNRELVGEAVGHLRRLRRDMGL
jgi:uracil-DNA glycosylase